MPFQIVHQDITKMNTEAIVNAANQMLREGGGVCGAIFAAAGAKMLQKACNQIGYCPTGGAVITPGFRLSAEYVIHAVGPIWRGGNASERELLAGAYRNSLELAAKYNVKSIAFPLISSGIYGYPKAEALRVAMDVFAEFLTDHEMDIYLAVYDRTAVELSEKLFSNLAHYIDTYYVEEPRRNRLNQASPCASVARPLAAKSKGEVFGERVLAPDLVLSANLIEVPEFLQKNKKDRSLDDALKNLSETFSQMVLRLIDEKGKKDSDIYRKANIDRKHFSKIRSNPDYNPKKSTAIALAIGLELSLDETVDLLGKAGYSLSPSSKFDVIIRFFIEQGEYDLFTINEALFCFEQPMLGV